MFVIYEKQAQTENLINCQNKATYINRSVHFLCQGIKITKMGKKRRMSEITPKISGH